MKKKKDGLRKQIKEKLSKLSDEELRAKSALLERRFLESPEFNSAESMLIYVSLPREPETRGVIKKALELKKRVYAPKVEGDYVCVCELHSLDRLRPGRFGIYEPPGEAKCDLREFDIVIVPGLAFDIHGNRLGRGGGFYDRLLSSINARFIGFAFEEQIVNRVPALEHDVRVHKIFTDTRVIECER